MFFSWSEWIRDSELDASEHPVRRFGPILAPLVSSPLLDEAIRGDGYVRRFTFPLTNQRPPSEQAWQYFEQEVGALGGRVERVTEDGGKVETTGVSKARARERVALSARDHGDVVVAEKGAIADGSGNVVVAEDGR